MGHPHQPGWHPSIRRVVTPSGRRVTLGMTSKKSTGRASATYSGIHRTTGDRLTIHKVDAGWVVFAWTKRGSENREKYGGRVTLASGLSTLSAAAQQGLFGPRSNR